MPRSSRTVALGIRALASRVSGRPALSQASIYPTYRCNLRCLYCSSPYMKTPEITASQWRGVISELAELGCRRVAVLGGEPLLRKDIGEILEAVRAHGMGCVLTSNGLLVARRLEALKGLDTLVLSLDAPGAANDRVRGEGVAAAVKDAIGLAKAARIPVKLNAVMSAETAGELEGLLRLAAGMDVSVTVNVVRTGNSRLWHRAADVAQDAAGTRGLLEKLARLSGSNPRILFSPRTYRFAAAWPDYTRDRLDEGDALAAGLAGAPRCHAGRAYFSIGPDGTTYPCALTAGEIAGGNVITDGVEAAWRRLHDHKCGYCYSPCMVEQNSLHSLKPAVAGHFLRRHLRRYA